MSDTPWTDKKTMKTVGGEIIYSDDARELERSHNRLLEALKDLSLYFQSGNDIPVERATILADSKEVKTMSEAIRQAIC